MKRGNNVSLAWVTLTHPSGWGGQLRAKKMGAILTPKGLRGNFGMVDLTQTAWRRSGDIGPWRRCAQREQGQGGERIHRSTNVAWLGEAEGLTEKRDTIVPCLVPRLPRPPVTAAPAI